jgi:hypothetical protein
MMLCEYDNKAKIKIRKLKTWPPLPSATEDRISFRLSIRE